jgi:hypothetical protein
MMRKRAISALAAFLLAAAGSFGQDLRFSGILDTQLAVGASSSDPAEFLWGLEEAANLRFQSRVGDAARFYGAVNLIAAAGSFALFAPLPDHALPGTAPASTPFVSGENYLAALELERLYVRVSGDYLGLDLGLMRLALGYGQVWGPSDFLNPKNPLMPNARPRAILGSAFSAFPRDNIKLQVFGAAPKNPFNANGEGLIFGLTGENHWDRLSAQLLCAYETPQKNYAAGGEYGIHRWGLSFKAEAGVGLVGDVLFTWDPSAGIGLDGLSAAAGFDYSFLGGDCYVLAEWLFNGEASSTSARSNPLTGLGNRNYLYATFRYGLNDFAAISAGGLASLDDISFMPVAAFEYELFQGMNLTLTAQVPLDRDLFSGSGDQGELGPAKSGSRLNVTTLLRLRF